VLHSYNTCTSNMTVLFAILVYWAFAPLAFSLLTCTYIYIQILKQFQPFICIYILYILIDLHNCCILTLKIKETTGQIYGILHCGINHNAYERFALWLQNTTIFNHSYCMGILSFVYRLYSNCGRGQSIQHSCLILT